MKSLLLIFTVLHASTRPQLDLTRLAASGQGSIRIQLIGETMLDAFIRVDAQITAEAFARGVELPELPSDPVLAKLSDLDGYDFDSEFLDEMVSRCDDALKKIDALPPVDPALRALILDVRDTLARTRADARRGRGEYVPLGRTD